MDKVDVVDAIVDLRGAEKGVSKARYYLCSDDQEYLVKLNRPDKKTAVNEFVAGTLARSLKLPVPKIVLVNFTEEFVGMKDLDADIEVGMHVGIKRLESAWDFDTLDHEKLRRKLINEKDLYGVVCFDNWTMNNDRNNKENNMLETLGNNKIKYWMIDFDRCFTSNCWTDVELNNRVYAKST